MILNYDLTGDENNSSNFTEEGKLLQLTGGQLVDQIRLERYKPNGDYDENKKDWNTETIMQMDFENSSLAAGTIGIDGNEITHIEIRRKKESDTEWTVLDRREVGENVDEIINFIDKTANPVEKYEYAVVPLNNKIESVYSVKPVTTEMDGIYIYDKDHRYKLEYNIKFGDFTHVIPNETHETIGNRQYPIVTYQGNIDYVKGHVDALLFATEDNYIDLYKEKINNEQIIKFLTNKKPKALKSYLGHNLMICITGDPSLRQKEGTGLYEVSFDFVEIGDMNNPKDLYECGFIDSSHFENN